MYIGEAPRLLYAGRFEIKDTEGNFVPGAKVTIMTNDDKVVISKLADSGGNVAIAPEEMQAGFKSSGVVQYKSLNYSASAPGMVAKRGVFFDPKKSDQEQAVVHTIELLKPGQAPVTHGVKIPIIGEMPKPVAIIFGVCALGLVGTAVYVLARPKAAAAAAAVSGTRRRRKR